MRYRPTVSTSASRDSRGRRSGTVSSRRYGLSLPRPRRARLRTRARRSSSSSPTARRISASTPRSLPSMPPSGGSSSTRWGSGIRMVRSSSSPIPTARSNTSVTERAIRSSRSSTRRCSVASPMIRVANILTRPMKRSSRRYLTRSERSGPRRRSYTARIYRMPSSSRSSSHSSSSSSSISSTSSYGRANPSSRVLCATIACTRGIGSSVAPRSSYRSGSSSS